MIWICKFFLSAEKTSNYLNRDPVNIPFSCSLFSGIWNGQLNAVAKSLWAEMELPETPSISSSTSAPSEENPIIQDNAAFREEYRKEFKSTLVTLRA
jgi:hypothetical protein